MKKRKVSRSKFRNKYGKSLMELSKQLKVSPSIMSKWESQGFDIYYMAENQHNIFRGNRVLQSIWKNMKQRCGNPNDPAYRRYGGNGIKIKMTKYDLLFLWKRDKAHKLKEPSIDRIDSNGNYEVSNCRSIEKITNTKRRWYSDDLLGLNRRRG